MAKPYEPTWDEERELQARGWRCDSVGRWWWFPGVSGRCFTYREAVHEADRRDREKIDLPIVPK